MRNDVQSGAIILFLIYIVPYCLKLLQNSYERTSYRRRIWRRRRRYGFTRKEAKPNREVENARREPPFRGPCVYRYMRARGIY